ncbi:hypothetical protein FQA39_LY10384 [Lamprigera yunnana]|nr:hypothetical protein FQA39_LY10384 [Lamprigera yunnana]
METRSAKQKMREIERQKDIQVLQEEKIEKETKIAETDEGEMFLVPYSSMDVIIGMNILNELGMIVNWESRIVKWDKYEARLEKLDDSQTREEESEVHINNIAARNKQVDNNATPTCSSEVQMNDDFNDFGSDDSVADKDYVPSATSSSESELDVGGKSDSESDILNAENSDTEVENTQGVVIFCLCFDCLHIFLL